MQLCQNIPAKYEVRKGLEGTMVELSTTSYKGLHPGKNAKSLMHRES